MKDIKSFKVSFEDLTKKVVKNSIISSGSRVLNQILTKTTNIGYIRGRIYEIFGPEGCGKTTLMLEAAADCCKKGSKGVIVDAEHAINLEYAKELGVDFAKIELYEPYTGEDIFEIIIDSVNKGVDFIGIDSVAAMVPTSEFEAGMDQEQMGAHARMIGKGLRKLMPLMKRDTAATIIFINQLRVKIGVAYGNPETRPGGFALKYLASGASIDVRSARSEARKLDGKEIGKFLIVKTVKNKYNSPFMRCRIPLTYGKGLDKLLDLAQYLKNEGFCEFSEKTITIKGYPRMNIEVFRERMNQDKQFNKKILGLIGE